MLHLARFLDRLDACGGADARERLLLEYLRRTTAHAAADAAWALQLLAGRRLKRSFSAAALRSGGARLAGLDGWLFDECLKASGDVAEVIALALPPGAGDDARGLAEWIGAELPCWPALPAAARLEALAAALQGLKPEARRLLLALAQGGLRRHATPFELQRALATLAGVPSTLIAERLAAFVDDAPTPAALQRLLRPATAGEGDGDGVGQPYPFHRCLTVDQTALPRQTEGGWVVQWLYPGRRVQAVRRHGRCWLWTAAGELVTGAGVAGVVQRLMALPDGTVLDGAMVAGAADQALTARAPAAKALRFLAFDLLERCGVDQRDLPLHERLQGLQRVLAEDVGLLAPGWDVSEAKDLAARLAAARPQGQAGIVIKPRHGHYREAQAWLACRAAPLAARAVLTQVQPADPRGDAAALRCGFSLWSRAPHDAADIQGVVDAIAAGQAPRPGALRLLPLADIVIAPADPAHAALQRAARGSMVQRYGPVRFLLPALICEIAFDAAEPNARRRSGLSLRGARVLRVCDDAALADAACVEGLALRADPDPLR